MTLGRRDDRGFTLIEMLIALLIFALLSAAGVYLLRGSLNSQAASARALDDLAASERLRAILGQDIGQMAQRPWRDQSGVARPAFMMAAPDGLLVFVRHGWSSDGGLPRSGLQRVAYRVVEGRLERVSAVYVDGAAWQEPAVLMRQVAGITVRVRDRSGTWNSGWTAADYAQLPRAVELTVDRTGRPPLVMAFLADPALPPPPPPSMAAPQP